ADIDLSTMRGDDGCRRIAPCECRNLTGMGKLRIATGDHNGNSQRDRGLNNWIEHRVCDREMVFPRVKEDATKSTLLHSPLEFRDGVVTLPWIHAGEANQTFRI